MFILDPKSRRTLRIVAILWLTFALLLLAAGFYLSRRVAAVESQRFPKLAQPCWSESEDHVAYLAQQPEGSLWELWQVGRHDEEPRRVGQLEAGEWTLLGWFDDDKRLLLQPRVQDVPKVTMVEVATGRQKDIRFESEGIRLLGVRGGQLFFERYGKGESADSLANSLTILNWSPGDEQLTQVVTIPFESEKLQVEAVWPSLNKRWLALSIMMGETQEERTLWFYDRERDKLTWSGIRLPCRAVRASWSPDSSGLVTAVETDTGCDLYAFWNILSGEHTRLSAGNERHSYQPFWPRGAKYFLLLENKLVYRFDPETLEATRLQAEGWDPRRTRDLAVSPRGTYGAYVAPEGDDDQLYTVSFEGKATENLLPLHPKTRLRDEWWYVLGESFNTALRTWTLRS